MCLDEEGSVADSDEDKANLLNATFHKVFKNDDGTDLTSDCILSPQQCLHDFYISEEDVSSAMHNIPDKLSRTPDGIPAYFWKRASAPFFHVIAFLFNLSLSQGVMPFQWKTAIVVPVFKKGSRDIPSNYRPISLTCVLCRVFESIIVSKLLCHLETFNLLSINQFGFLPKRSSSSQLLCVLFKCFYAFDSKNSVDLIYTDVAKAFDSVCHSKLISVLSRYGVKDNVLNWIKCFLTDRSQRVCINNICSASLPVKSGVPQGSILGPLLFVIYINDAPSFVSKNNPNCEMFLYADDAKLFSNNAFSLQQGLDKFTNWLKLHQLDLAVAKCEHLCISRNHCSNSYFAGSLNIKTVSVVKDLGVYISDNLKWSYHISHIHRNASLCSYQILRSFSTKNIWILLKAFITYVRPKVEFNTCVWSPYLKKDIVLLESVQRNFTRYAFTRCNIPFKSYNDRLCKLGIKSLEYRRLEFDLILMFKICHNLCDLQFSNYFEYRHCKYNLR